MLSELIRAFLLIFAAEMGDKTQIIAMTFATQFKVKDVIGGVTLGVLLNHGIAIILGNFISKVVPMNFIQIIAGALFIIFGINALKIDEGEEIESKKVMSPIATVALAFFVGELGDKTQLTAMTLSAEANYPLFILMGTTLGMIATSGLGIFVGSKIGNKIPEEIIKIISSLVFVSFGTIKLINTIPKVYLSLLNVMIFLIAIVYIESVLIFKLMKTKKIVGEASTLREAADSLYRQTQELKETLDSICLGEDKCGTCTGVGCLLGYTRFILKEARDKGDYYNSFYVNTDKLIKKQYERSKVVDALIMILKDYEEYGWEINEDFVVVKIKNALEVYLFGKKLINVHNLSEYLDEVDGYDFYLGARLRKMLL